MILSIIIPIYNGQDYVARCINSLLNQNLPVESFEIIAINDGSIDSSVQIIEQFADKNENIRLVNHTNRGLGATRNVGIELAKGKYIYFLDVDDYLATDTLKHLIDCINSNNLQVLTFQTQVTNFGKLNKSINKNSFPLDINIVDGYQYIADNNYRNEAWWYIIDLEFLRNTGLKFPEGVWMEDSIFTTKLFLSAKRMALLPLDAHRYVKVSNSILSRKDPIHYIKVINDTLPVVEEYKKIIKTIKLDEKAKYTIDRLKNRQQSFVFFLIIRAIKSQLNYDQIKTILVRMKNADAYPMDHFINKEYNKPIYHILVFIFNKPFLLFLSYKFYRSLRSLKIIS